MKPPTNKKIAHHVEPPDSGNAFIPDVVRTHEPLKDDEAEAYAEEVIASATSAEYMGEDARDEMVDEELGGPFLEFKVNLPEEGKEGKHPPKSRPTK